MDKKDLNNKIIILRKNLKSTFNLTKLNLIRKIEKIKDPKQVQRKKTELECFKRLKSTDISLHLGVDPTKLQKTLTNPASSEIDKVIAKVLLNKQIQETLSILTDSYGIELVRKFLISNEGNIKKNLTEKLNKGKNSTKSRKKPDVNEESQNDDEGEVLEVGRTGKGNGEVVDIDDSRGMETMMKKAIKSADDSKLKAGKRIQIKDSFFVDAAGENYFASVATASSSSSKNGIEENTKKMPRKPLKNQKKLVKCEEPKIRSKISLEAKPAVENIHPSWVQAKAQMRKTQIQLFSGIKIKFDD